MTSHSTRGTAELNALRRAQAAVYNARRYLSEFENTAAWQDKHRARLEIPQSETDRVMAQIAAATEDLARAVALLDASL